MSKGIGNPTPTKTLVHRLRLMADSGGILTRDRIRTIIEAADRLEEQDEKITELADRYNTSLDSSMFP